MLHAVGTINTRSSNMEYRTYNKRSGKHYILKLKNEFKDFLKESQCIAMYCVGLFNESK